MYVGVIYEVCLIFNREIMKFSLIIVHYKNWIHNVSTEMSRDFFICIRVMKFTPVLLTVIEMKQYNYSKGYDYTLLFMFGRF